MTDEFDRRQARKRTLDDAVHEYMLAGIASGDFAGDSMVTGWVIAIAVTHVASIDETDGCLIDSSPGINNYMARGLADTGAELFQIQSMGHEDE